MAVGVDVDYFQSLKCDSEDKILFGAPCGFASLTVYFPHHISSVPICSSTACGSSFGNAGIKTTLFILGKKLMFLFQGSVQ